MHSTLRTSFAAVDAAIEGAYVLDFGLNAADSERANVAVRAAPFAVAVADAVHQTTV